jgi:hypothetical protein
MKMSKIVTKEIERRLALLDALEAGGVDNWEGYDFATEELRKQAAIEERCEEIMESICEILSQGVEEPAGRGAGYGFKTDNYCEALDILVKAVLAEREKTK